MLIKRAKTRRLFFAQTMGSNNFFTLIENNFWFFKIAKFEVFTCIIFLRLTTGKNEKRVFLPCPYHEIYRDEAVGLKSCKYT